MKTGDVAPEFELPDQDGVLRRLSTMLESGPVVVFFYPLASSSGCTTEMCTVRDQSAQFAAVGAQRVGVSRDSVESQKRFAVSNGFDYPLLADVDGTMCEAYGVKRNLSAAPVKRHTVVIGTDGIVKDVFKSEFRFSKHADKALAALTPR
ncbi:redoxin domain-containing protein [Modestobacter sp. I12A-02628]|uniref:thioredoxin-dependent peroxiredoxin n=1 Tax=Goekera deserti TaxID=2497753 RepID=A0A7K3WLA7_9ACTN|nr:peroxiredoxin [Goekera deserti]MPR00410.1 redoxin domain-containing protein [Goekera deserti]NDI50386.1 redoxin domain-containing protein [Goekera deserti]NEL56669.1 peroxiredoxin [Goekera deserti]